MARTFPSDVLLATADEDVALCVGAEAARMAQEIANDLRVMVLATDPTSGKVLARFAPAGEAV